MRQWKVRGSRCDGRARQRQPGRVAARPEGCYHRGRSLTMPAGPCTATSTPATGLINHAAGAVPARLPVRVVQFGAGHADPLALRVHELPVADIDADMR